MANTRVSNLSAGSAVAGADLFYGVQTVGVGGVKITATQLKTFMSASPTLVTPNLGTPSAGVMTNVTGTAAGLTAGNVTTNANLTGPITSTGNATSVASQTGTGSIFVMNTSPTLVTPNLGTPSAGVMTNVTGTAAGLTAGSVTTNANLTGPITSVGNATSVASQTGTGSKFVMDTSPTLVTPDIGTPSAGVATNLTGTASGLTAGNVTTNANLSGPITSTGNTTAVASQTGTGSKFVMDTSPVLVTPNLGTTSAGVATNLTGTAAGLTAGNVTTNANLTGPITSVGNTTSVGSQTGTGSTFVMNTSPTLVTPNLGTPSAVVLTNASGTAASLTAGAATALATGRTIAITGDISYTSPSFNGTGNVTAAGTLATVNSNVGTFGDATNVAQVTFNAKGLVTAVSNVPISVTATPGGSTTQVQFNNAGALAGDTGLTYNSGTGTLTITNLVLTNALPVLQGGTGSTTSTGTGAVVRANTPTLITPNIGAATGGSLVASGLITAGATISTTLTTGGLLAGTASGPVQAGTTGQIRWNLRTRMTSPADGQLLLTDTAATSFALLQFGGSTSSFPAIKRSTTGMQARLADDSAFTFIQGQLRTDAAATTGLTAGVLAATTNASIVVYDSTGQAYRIPCII